MSGDKVCSTGHTWTHEWCDDWEPKRGTLCDCGKKQWGIPLRHTAKCERVTHPNSLHPCSCGVDPGFTGTVLGPMDEDDGSLAEGWR